MVLETLVNPDNAEKKYYWMIFLGVLFSFVGAFLAYVLKGPGSPSLLMIFFTAIPAIPVMYAIIKYEEEKDVIYESEKKLLKEHSKAIKAFMCLFLGATLGMTFIFVVTPYDVNSLLFEIQLEEFKAIRSQNFASGLVTESQPSQFGSVFFNNLRVLMLAILFSFLFGAGAIFVLMWNASVIATAIGYFIEKGFADLTNMTGFPKFILYFEIVTVGLLMYALHGFFEIAAYFVAALAGGIISVAVIKHEFKSPYFDRIVLDSVDLMVLSIVLLFIGAFLEVFVTPLIF